jgi:hypothetical protein
MATTTTVKPVGISWSHRMTASVVALLVAVLVTVALIASFSGSGSHSPIHRAPNTADCLVRASFHAPC